MSGKSSEAMQISSSVGQVSIGSLVDRRMRFACCNQDGWTGRIGP